MSPGPRSRRDNGLDKPADAAGRSGAACWRRGWTSLPDGGAAVRQAATHALLILFCVSAVGVASATDLGLITAGESGTYCQFGQDLRRLAKRGGIELRVYPSRGSIDNIRAVFEGGDVKLGIVQADV